MSEYLEMDAIEDLMKNDDFLGMSPLSKGLWVDMEEVEPRAIIDDSVSNQIII